MEVVVQKQEEPKKEEEKNNENEAIRAWKDQKMSQTPPHLQTSTYTHFRYRHR